MAARKKPWVQKQGEESPHSRFTEEQIIEIIEKFISGIPSKDIVKEYGLTQCYLSRLVKRQNWKCVKHPKERYVRWRAYLAKPQWQGVKRNEWYIAESLRLFDESFGGGKSNAKSQKN